MPPREDEGAHELTLAVWDVPSPVVTGRPFTVKVGAKCSHGCDLRGAGVEIRGDVDSMVGSGIAGPTPWAGTTALYWTEVEITSPEVDGARCWTASMTAAEQQLHPTASSTFCFVAVRPPEHLVTLKLTNRDRGTPLIGAEVRFGPFRAATDDDGVARIELPSGTFEVTAWKAGYDAASRWVHVAGSVSIELELADEPVVEEPYWM